MPTIIAVCTSPNKGMRKHNVSHGYLKQNFGLVGDAHADNNSVRQVSLLDISSINEMRECGLTVNPGDFAENLTTEGLDLDSIKTGTLLEIGEKVLLEITQIGKQCHKGCAIFRQVGTCIMPKEGIFARVLKGGEVKVGNQIKIIQKSEQLKLT